MSTLLKVDASMRTYLQSFFQILSLCVFPLLGSAQPDHLLPQKDKIFPIEKVQKCYQEMSYNKNMTIEEIEEIIGSIKDIDTCALLLLERKMYDDWIDVAKIYSQEGRELKFAYYEYWTNLIRQDSLGTDFKYFILNESYCDHYWSSEVRHEPTDELCGELLYVNGTDLVEAVYLRALILNKKLEHIYRVEGCSREYTSGLFYLINLRQSLYVDNAYGSHPLMSLKGKELFYNASIRVGECKGFTKEVFEIFNLGGDVKHLFVKEKDE